MVILSVFDVQFCSSGGGDGDGGGGSDGWSSPPANASWLPTIEPDANSNTTAAIDAMLRAMVVFGFIGYIDYVDL